MEIKPFSEDISYGQGEEVFGMPGLDDYDYRLSKEILEAAKKGKKDIVLGGKLKLAITDNIVKKAKMIQAKGIPFEAKNVLIKPDGTIEFGTKAGKPMSETQFATALKKNKVAAPYRKAEFKIFFDEGVSSTADVLDTAIQLGIVNKAGAWISYKENKWQGDDNARKDLIENPELCSELKDSIEATKTKDE